MKTPYHVYIKPRLVSTKTDPYAFWTCSIRSGHAASTLSRTYTRETSVLSECGVIILPWFVLQNPGTSSKHCIRTKRIGRCRSWEQVWDIQLFTLNLLTLSCFIYLFIFFFF